MTFGDVFCRLLRLGSAGQTRIRTVTGTPEAVVTGAIGDLVLRTDGAVGTTVYTKTSGSGTTGWTAVGAAAAGTVTTTGSPANGNLTKFTAAATVSNADLTGDVTTSGTVATTIAAAAVTLAKMANVATDRLIGRDTAATGVPEALTVSGGVEFTGSGGIQRSALTGDVTATAGSNATTIAADAVTYAKLQNTAAATRLIGRGSAAGAGDPEEITLGAGLSMAGTVISSTVVGTGGGDFVGPGSSTNNGFVKYDGTTGKLAKDGAATIALASEVSGVLPVANGGSRIKQIVQSQISAVATGTTIIPFDDTIPQNTEGDEYLTLAITPSNASSTLYIDVVLMAGPSLARWACVALFQDATADALAATAAHIPTATAAVSIPLSYAMTAGTTSSTTFKVRAGVELTSSTLTVNGQAGARRFGAIPKSSIKITEVLP